MNENQKRTIHYSFKATPEEDEIIQKKMELAGIKNIRTKSLGSNNKANVVLATLAGLCELKTPEEVAKLRGKSVEEIMN